MRMKFQVDIDEQHGIIEVDINGARHVCHGDDDLYVVLREWAFDVAEAVADASPTARLERWAREGWDG